MLYIFDECISDRIVTALKELGFHDVIHLDEIVRRGTPDSDFLPQIGARGDVLVTVDPAMLGYSGKHGHRALLEQYNVKVLILPKMFSNMKSIEQRNWIALHWETIVKNRQDHPDMTLGRVAQNGNVEPIPGKTRLLRGETNGHSHS